MKSFNNFLKNKPTWIFFIFIVFILLIVGYVIPQTGGQKRPKQIYLAYRTALQKGNLKEIKQYLSKNRLNQIEGSANILEPLKTVKMLAPEDIQEIVEQINGNKSIIILNRKKATGIAKGMVEMVLEDGRWKIDREEWQSNGIALILNDEENTVAGENSQYINNKSQNVQYLKYKILDIQYKKDLISGVPEILITIKNTGTEPIQKISLKCIINGLEVIGYQRSGIGGPVLKPGEKKSIFDMIYCYKDYLLKVEEFKNKKLPYYELNIKLLSKDNNATFEKRLSIKELIAEVIESEEDGFIIYDVIFK